MNRYLRACSAKLGLLLSVIVFNTQAQTNGNQSPTLDAANTCTPVYPESARAAKLAGTVVARFLIGPDGKVMRSKLQTSSGHAILDNATIAEYSKCKFKPAIIDGKPDADWLALSVDWEAPKEEMTAEAASTSTQPGQAAGPTQAASFDLSSPCKKPVAPRVIQSTGLVLKGITGMSLLISNEGKVIDGKIVSSSGTAKLDTQALEAHMLCKFKPALVSGKPTETWNSLNYDWAK